MICYCKEGEEIEDEEQKGKRGNKQKKPLASSPITGRDCHVTFYFICAKTKGCISFCFYFFLRRKGVKKILMVI